MTREEYKRLCESIAPCWYGEYRNEIHQWWMQQQPEEFGDLIEIISQIHPKRILEIGSAHGGTLPYFDHVVGKGGIVIGMEPQLDRGFSVVKPPYSTYQPVSQLVFINDYSYKPEVFNQVANFCSVYGLLDFLFIDGDHNYINDSGTSGAKIDYNMYAPLVRKGGYIGFHDIALEPGCKRAWEEACDTHERIDILIRYMGIGLVKV